MSVSFENIFGNMEEFFEGFNKFAPNLFILLKYLLAFILIMGGINLWLKLRKTSEQRKESKWNPNLIKKPQFVLGILYISLGVGILFNYTSQLLIIIFEPLPDQIIFDLIPSSIDLNLSVHLKLLLYFRIANWQEHS